MFGLFLPRFNAADNANLLVSYRQNGVTFNPDPEVPRHARLVDECSAEMNKKLCQLRAIDHKIIIACGIGVAALCLSWMTPFGVLAHAAMIYAAAQWGLRQQAYAEYYCALENLMRCCQWVLGKDQADVRDGEDTIFRDDDGNAVIDQEIVNHPDVQQMRAILYPLIDENTLQKLIADDVRALLAHEIDPLFYDEVENMPAQDLNGDYLPPNREHATFDFLTYGHGKGYIIDIADGTGYAIFNPVIAACNWFTDNADIEPSTSSLSF